jgi:hypothetical protein
MKTKAVTQPDGNTRVHVSGTRGKWGAEITLAAQRATGLRTFHGNSGIGGVLIRGGREDLRGECPVNVASVLLRK